MIKIPNKFYCAFYIFSDKMYLASSILFVV